MWKLFRFNLKQIARNRQFAFWSLAFPLIFTAIFGAFFGSQTGEPTGTIAIVEDPATRQSQAFVTALKRIPSLTVTSYDTAAEARTALDEGVVIVVAEFDAPTMLGGPTPVTLRYDPADMQAVAPVRGVIDGLATQLTLQLTETAPLFTLTDEPTSEDFNYFNFVLLGLIGMSVMNSNIQGIAIGISRYREAQILKRITTTPLPSWKFILAEVAARLVLNLIQIALILIIGIYGFGATLATGSIPLVVAIAILGALMFQLIGFVLTSFVSTVQAAEGMAAAITVPMMFLGGVFFPLDSLPDWFRRIVELLPLAPLLGLIRSVGLEGLSIRDDLGSLTIVLGWIVLLLVIAANRFRLGEE